MNDRRSIEIDTFEHSTPIPSATRIGPLLVSSIVVGRDPGATTVPHDTAAQIANLFHHVGNMLAAGGAEWRHVAKMTFYLPDLDMRRLLDEPWVAHFPDPTSRPSRHTQVAPVAQAQCDFVAYVTD